MKAKIDRAVITWEGLNMEWTVFDDAGRPVYSTKRLIERRAQESDNALIARGNADALTDSNRVKATYSQGGRDVMSEMNSLE